MSWASSLVRMRVERETPPRDSGGLAVAREGAFPFWPMQPGTQPTDFGRGYETKFKTIMHIKLRLPATATVGYGFILEIESWSNTTHNTRKCRDSQGVSAARIPPCCNRLEVNRATNDPASAASELCEHLAPRGVHPPAHLTLQLGWSHHARHC